MTDAFDEFFGNRELGIEAAFPHRPKCRNRKLAKMYWTGQKPLIDDSRIMELDHPRILAGARAWAEIAPDPEWRVNVCTWLYNGRWEDALEEAGELQADQETDRAAQARLDAKEAELARDMNGGCTWPGYRADESGLKVVG